LTQQWDKPTIHRIARLNEAWKLFPDFAAHRIDLNINARNAPFMMGLAVNSYGVSVVHAPAFVLIDPESGGSYDLVDFMTTETFHALFFGMAGGPCSSTQELLNSEDQAAPGISDVGKMVLYYFALR